MLYEAKSMNGYVLCSLDGEIGKLDEFFFSSHNWKIRYLVAKTGSWLKGRKVLVSPDALTAVDVKNQCIKTNLTRKQFKESPPLESDLPVSRQCEESYFKFFSWPVYYDKAYSDDKTRMFLKYGEDASAIDLANERKSADPELHSMRDVRGFGIITPSGEFGRIVDFIIDDATWSLRYFVVDTQDKWYGKKILVAPDWIENIHWGNSKVFIRFSCETLKMSADYTDISMLTPEYENTLLNNCACIR